MRISRWLARRREQRALQRERTGDTPQKLAERRKPSMGGEGSPTDAMVRTGTVGFLGGSF